MPTKVELFQNRDFGGARLAIDANTPQLPLPFGNRETSSLKVHTREWVKFYENDNFNEDDDVLWIEGDRPDDPNLRNLHTLPRPHGNEHWGDRILSVSFPGGPPSAETTNCTIYWKNGKIELRE